MVSRYSITDVREITFNAPILDSRISRSLWMPLLNDRLSSSAATLVNGSTAIDACTASAAAPGVSGVVLPRGSHSRMAHAASATTTAAPILFHFDPPHLLEGAAVPVDLSCSRS